MFAVAMESAKKTTIEVMKKRELSLLGELNRCHFRYKMWIKRAQGNSQLHQNCIIYLQHQKHSCKMFSVLIISAVWKSCLLADPLSIDPTKVCNIISCCNNITHFVLFFGSCTIWLDTK